STRNPWAIMGVTHRPCAASMRAPVFDLFAVFHFPEFDGPIFAGGSEKFRIPAPTQSGDCGFVAGESEKFLRIVWVPDTNAAVSIGARQHLAVRTESNGGHPIGVFLDLVLQFAGFGGEDFYEATGPSERDLR